MPCLQKRDGVADRCAAGVSYITVSALADLHCGAGSEKRRGCESHDTDEEVSEQKMAQKCHRKHCPIGEQRFRKKSAKSYMIFKNTAYKSRNRFAETAENVGC